MADDESQEEENAAPAAAPKGPSPWPPLLAVIVLMPAISFATTQFLILPRMRGVLAEQQVLAAAGGAKEHEKEGGHGDSKEGKPGEAAGKFSYDFENVVVNLSGAMGTRYLKTSFTVFSGNHELKKLIEENKKQLADVCITVLSTRTLADLEVAGAKNVVRNDLLANLNQALKTKLIEQIYFTEFVVQ